MIGRHTTTLASAIGVALLVAACATSPAPGDGTPSPPATGIPSPSASGTQPVVSPDPTSSPTEPEDAFVDLPATEGGLNAISITDGMIVAGGFAGPAFTASILAFDRGTWSVSEVPDVPGQVTGIASLGDRWIAVGHGLPDDRSGFIWDSADGRVWQPVRTIADAALYDVVADTGVIVAVGAGLDAEMNATAAAWTSTDGTDWEPAQVAGSGEASMGSVAATPTGFVAVGDRPLGAARPVWAATNATSWEALPNDLSDQLLPSEIVAWGARYALVGASGKSGDQHPFIALSSDGSAWDQTDLSPNEGYASAMAVVDEGLVVAGIDADQLTLWWLDGDVRQADTFEPGGASVSALALDADLGLVGVGVRDGNHATWVFDKP